MHPVPEQRPRSMQVVIAARLAVVRICLDNPLRLS
jgi:hypothetical protein